jgi:hypothetical protein
MRQCFSVATSYESWLGLTIPAWGWDVTLYIIQNHLHPNLKLEYVMEEEPHTLWVALKGRYEQQKVILLPEANHE